MKKPMKTKRYADEGLVAEDKKKGLEASKDEKVGFIERLRMGNIDDPKSEAYKRFGAGRGAAERAKTATPFTSGASSGMGVAGFGAPMGPQETIDRTPKGVPGFGAPMLPKPVEERAPSNIPGLTSAVQGAGVGEGGVSPGVKGPSVVEKKTTTVKTPRKTVTETSKVKTGSGASGFDTDEKGIARRRMEGLKAPKTSELRSVARTRAGTQVKPDDSGTLGALGLGLGAAGLGLAGLRKRLMRAEAGGGSESRDMSRYVRNSPVRELDPMLEASRMADEGNPNFKKGGKVKPKVKKYASGGMVGKASKRADGIAKKGKTKGRII